MPKKLATHKPLLPVADQAYELSATETQGLLDRFRNLEAEVRTLAAERVSKDVIEAVLAGIDDRFEHVVRNRIAVLPTNEETLARIAALEYQVGDPAPSRTQDDVAEIKRELGELKAARDHMQAALQTMRNALWSVKDLLEEGT